ncbi:TPA: hypothetical protein ACTYGH_002493 [Citrobacter freundii]
MIRLVVIVERRDFKPCVGAVAGLDVGNTDKELFQPLLYEGVGLNPPAINNDYPETIMQKNEPKIVADGYSTEEIYAWMKQKISASRMLDAAFTERELLKHALEDCESRIEELTNSSALELSTAKDTSSHCAVDERTYKDIQVIIYLLKKPTGNAKRDEENAALADMYSTALKSGKVVGFISDDAPGVIEARKALGQIS